MARNRSRDDDEDDDDDVPAPRKRKKKRRRVASGNLTAWLVGGLILGLVLIACVAVVVVSGNRKKGPPAPPELQGTWRMLSLEKNGVKRSGGGLPVDRIVITGDVFAVYGTDGDDFESRVRVDATRDPKELDLLDRGASFPAIYKIEGDTLTICINDAGAPRPREFSTRGLVGTGGMATYQRAGR